MNDHDPVKEIETIVETVWSPDNDVVAVVNIHIPHEKYHFSHFNKDKQGTQILYCPERLLEDPVRGGRFNHPTVFIPSSLTSLQSPKNTVISLMGLINPDMGVVWFRGNQVTFKLPGEDFFRSIDYHFLSALKESSFSPTPMEKTKYEQTRGYYKEYFEFVLQSLQQYVSETRYKVLNFKVDNWLYQSLRELDASLMDVIVDSTVQMALVNSILNLSELNDLGQLQNTNIVIDGLPVTDMFTGEPNTQSTKRSCVLDAIIEYLDDSVGPEQYVGMTSERRPLELKAVITTLFEAILITAPPQHWLGKPVDSVKVSIIVPRLTEVQTRRFYESLYYGDTTTQLSPIKTNCFTRWRGLTKLPKISRV